MPAYLAIGSVIQRANNLDLAGSLHFLEDRALFVDSLVHVVDIHLGHIMHGLFI